MGALGPQLHAPEISECKYWLRFHNPLLPHEHVDGLTQDCSISIANVENQLKLLKQNHNFVDFLVYLLLGCPYVFLDI